MDPHAEPKSAAAKLTLARDNALLLVIDVQERLASAMPPEVMRAVLKNTLLLVEAAKALALPVVVSEQYPKGLGATLGELAAALPPGVKPHAKTAFSCGAVKDLALDIFQSGRRQIIVAGMEAHVCVFQTARDLALGGYAPFVPRDAVCSRTKANWRVGLELMRDAGATLTSTETVVFDLLGEAGTPEFKKLSALLK